MFGSGRGTDIVSFLTDLVACGTCPQGKSLEYKTTTSQTRNQTTRVRDRYQSDGKVCADCPLKSLCLSGKSKARLVYREQHESLHETHAAKMATAEAQQKYATRRHAGERPFAVIKQKFGARQFLLRGLDRVQQEWTWLTMAFNLDRLLNLIPTRAGPFSQSAPVKVHPP